ncbi:MAG: L-serine ammonia-lyase, iron-sulfur-dependent, subunit alpha [Bacillota bacterium]|nr:L-serine ammonia-lyase, iron-sulfur-dependent, subunit alpha [Bacillota bacterium]
MHELTKIIKNDMVPALGVTEPGAIAFITSTAKSYTVGEVKSVELSLSSSIYKGAFTCGIPGVEEVGNRFAAALGVCGADHTKGLESLDSIDDESREKAKKMIEEGKIKVSLHSITPDIYLNARVCTEDDICEVTVEDRHTNITKIKLNGETVFSAEKDGANSAEQSEGAAESEEAEEAVSIEDIKKYSFTEIVNYARDVDIEEIRFIKEAYTVNLALLEEGFKSPRTTLGHNLYKQNGNAGISENELATAQFVTNTALEARVIGLSKPAMSITGSGAHGILCTMPLYACWAVNEMSEEKLLRATALSYLITIYIKVHSGIMSAFCGCAIAAGTGAAVALCYMKGGNILQMNYTLNNMASSITGMICDGGNKGCTLKGVVAVDMAHRAVNFALANAYVESVHAINGRTPEETMKNMGLIASPGMLETEKVILDIFENKNN